MGDKTGIQWTDATWNPLRGCSRVSKGCEHCYAEGVAHRFSASGQPYDGLVEVGRQGPRWNGNVKLALEHLGDPLRWTKQRMVFVNSMSDLFHEKVPFEFIAAVFGVMAASPKHTFQVLTKRPKRMLEFFEWYDGHAEHGSTIHGALWAAAAELNAKYSSLELRAGVRLDDIPMWPLENVWLGVSVEDQTSADERIPLLFRAPAAVRWVSAEPLLGPVELASVADGAWYDAEGANMYDALRGRSWWSHGDSGIGGGPALDWIVVGGESGPGAREFDVGWARSIVEQCASAQVPCFVKQLGSNLVTTREEDLEQYGAWRVLEPGKWSPILSDRKGGDPSEWPEDLRVREWPRAIGGER